MSDTGKLARGRASTRPAAGIARNQSALLVNPLDPRHIVGIEEISGPGMIPAVRARVSFDGGASWRESWQLPVEPGWTAVVGPALAMDAGGTLHVAALAISQDHSLASLVTYCSLDGGIHWSRPTTVLRAPRQCSYSMAADLNADSRFRGQVYLAAEAGQVLYLAHSSGGEFAASGRESQSAALLPGPCFSPEVLVDASGAVHLFWITAPDGSSILSAISSDGGESFSRPIVVAKGIVGPREGHPETLPAVSVAPSGAAVCAWADQREDHWRIYCRRSTDGGRTWFGPLDGEPLTSQSTPGQIEFQPHLLVTTGGEICCAFYEYGPRDPGGDPLVDLVMTVSYDQGATFTGRMVLSHQPWDPAADTPLSREATRGALGWLALS